MEFTLSRNDAVETAKEREAQTILTGGNRGNGGAKEIDSPCPPFSSVKRLGIDSRPFALFAVQLHGSGSVSRVPEFHIKSCRSFLGLPLVSLDLGKRLGGKPDTPAIYPT